MQKEHPSTNAWWHRSQIMRYEHELTPSANSGFSSAPVDNERRESANKMRKTQATLHFLSKEERSQQRDADAARKREALRSLSEEERSQKQDADAARKREAYVKSKKDTGRFAQKDMHGNIVNPSHERASIVTDRKMPVLTSFEDEVAEAKLPSRQALASLAESPSLPPAAVTRIAAHEADLAAVTLVLCNHCCRRYPYAMKLNMPNPIRTSGEALEWCRFCSRGKKKHVDNLYTEANLNFPGPPRHKADVDAYWSEYPHLLANAKLATTELRVEFFTVTRELFAEATLVEELLVTRFRTFMIFRRAPHQHVKFRGHTITHLQHVETLFSFAPSRLPIAIFRHPASVDMSGHKDYRVNTSRLVKLVFALRLLYPQKELYGDPAVVPATDDAVRALAEAEGLPEDGSIFDSLQRRDDDDVPSESSVGPTGAPITPAGSAGQTFSEFDALNMDSSFVPEKSNTANTSEIARRGVDDVAQGRRRKPGEEPIAWPEIDADAQPERRPYLMIGSFPLRFLNAHADFNPERFPRSTHVSREDYFEGLMWYWDDVQCRYPFAVHPMFKYWALNNTFRWRALELANVFVKGLPYNMSATDLQDQVNAGNDYTINKLFARAGQIKGTAGYWMAQRTKWYNLLLYWFYFYGQLPSVFLTVSEPELHDPYLHEVLHQLLHDRPSARYLHDPQPPADELLRRKKAVTENLHIVTWFFMHKIRTLHHRVLVPSWGIYGDAATAAERLKTTPTDDFKAAPGLGLESGGEPADPMAASSVHAPAICTLPRPPALGGFGGRIEFADRRNMSHLHELIMLPDAPDAAIKFNAILECGTNLARADAPHSRYIVAWVAEKLGLTAIHTARCAQEWPMPEGVLPKEEKNQAGFAALRRRFQDLAPADRRNDETAILSYCMLHGPCDNYCLRDVVRKDGEVVGQRCRMHAELKEKHCCRCPKCVPRTPVDGTPRCEPCDEQCPQDGNTACKAGCCVTRIWMLPTTFRFELRICRRHSRLQVTDRCPSHIAVGCTVCFESRRQIHCSMHR